MGMFDWVEAPSITCDCGEEVTGWQSKDAECTLAVISPDEVNRYYSSCRECGMWHDFIREEPDPKPLFKHVKTPRADQ